jgi:hypothetical protein
MHHLAGDHDNGSGLLPGLTCSPTIPFCTAEAKRASTSLLQWLAQLHEESAFLRAGSSGRQPQRSFQHVVWQFRSGATTVGPCPKLRVSSQRYAPYLSERYGGSGHTSLQNLLSGHVWMDRVCGNSGRYRRGKWTNHDADDANDPL